MITPEFNIEYMAKLLKKAGKPDTILFLGSRTSSLFRYSTWVDDLLKGYSHGNISKMKKLEKFRECYDILDNFKQIKLEKYKNSYSNEDLCDDDIDHIIKKALQKHLVAAADTYVAQLIKEGIFDCIITTNIGSELKFAFRQMGMKEHDDFQVIIPGSGAPIVKGNVFKIIKVSGDVVSKRYSVCGYHINKKEIYLDQYPELKTFLEPLKEKNMLMVGFDPSWDNHVLHTIFPRREDSLWYINQEQTLEDSQMHFYLQACQAKRFESANEGNYEIFFTRLCQLILGELPPVYQVTPSELPISNQEGESLIDKDPKSPPIMINHQEEMQLIEQAFRELLSNKNSLSRPIIDFFGIAGIGKTRILEEIADRCKANNLPCIKLDEQHTQLNGSQNISKISREIFKQTKKYRQKSQKAPPQGLRRDISPTQTIEAIKAILRESPLVILLDAIDSSNETLVNWITTTLHELIEHNNLFVVLTSKQKIVFENDWLMTRKLTPLPLKPLNRDDSASYLKSLYDTISVEWETIFQWTRGYPSAMEVMMGAIEQYSFDITKNEDQKQLIDIILKKVLHRKVFAHIERSQLNWYEAHLLLLSIPRRFNFSIVHELLEKFGPASISEKQSKLEYMGLQKQLNTGIDILHWDVEKAAYTIDELIRNIFFIYQQLHHPSLFMDMHRYLAQRNQQLATEVTGSGSVRYLCEYLYHSAQDRDTQIAEAMLQSIKQKFSNMSSDVKIQFTEQFMQDEGLQEILRQHYKNVYLYIKEHIGTEE